MPSDQATIIARCAQVAEDAAAELQAALKTRTPKSRTQRTEEKMTVARVRYGVRWCKLIAGRIRLLDKTNGKPAKNGDRLSTAVSLLRELRPSIAGAHDSRWKSELLRRIDDVLARDD